MEVKSVEYQRKEKMVSHVKKWTQKIKYIKELFI